VVGEIFVDYHLKITSDTLVSPQYECDFDTKNTAYTKKACDDVDDD